MACACCAEKHVITNGHFATVSMGDQLRLVQAACVIVGAHG